jgi:hypothetical protein
VLTVIEPCHVVNGAAIKDNDNGVRLTDLGLGPRSNCGLKCIADYFDRAFALKAAVVKREAANTTML